MLSVAPLFHDTIRRGLNNRSRTFDIVGTYIIFAVAQACLCLQRDSYKVRLYHLRSISVRNCRDKR